MLPRFNSRKLISRILIVFSLLMILFQVNPSYAQDPSTDAIPTQPLQLLASQDVNAGNFLQLVNHFGGSSQMINIYSHYAYVGIGSELVVFDLSNPDSPLPVSSLLLNDNPQSILFEPPYAYLIAGWDYLKVLNISDPSHPTIVAEADTQALANQIKKNGNYLYLCGSNSIEIFRIADSRLPEHVSITYPGNLFSDCQVYGDYFYMSAYNSFYIYRMSDPANPVEVKIISDAGGYMKMQWPYLYFSNPQVVYNLSNPENPQIVTSAPTANLVWYNEVTNGNYGYRFILQGNFSDRVYQTDLETFDSTSRGTISTQRFPSMLTRGAAYRGRLYLTNGNLGGIFILNLDNPALPKRQTFLSIPGAITEMSISGTKASAISYGQGLYTFDLTNPAVPVYKGFMQLPVSTFSSILVEGNYSYALLGDSGIFVVDTLDQANPRVIDNPGLHKTAPQWSTVHKNTMFVGRGSDGGSIPALSAYSLTDPGHPTLLDSFDFGWGEIPMRVTFLDNFAYFTRGYSISVLDVSQQNDLQEIPINPSYYCDGRSVPYIVDNYLYLKYCVLSLEDPRNPQFVTNVETFNTIYDRALYEKVLFVSGLDDSQNVYIGRENIAILNVSDPANPQLMDRIALPIIHIEDIAIYDDYLYVFGGDDGIYIYKINPLELSGNAVDYLGRPMSSVRIDAEGVGYVTTNEYGGFQFDSLIPGEYTLTPLKDGVTFQPAKKTVLVEQNIRGIRFVGLPEPVSTDLDNTAGKSLVLVDFQGLETRIDFPAGSTPGADVSILNMALASGVGGFVSTNHSFELTIQQNGFAIPDYSFTLPVSVTIHYSDTDMAAVTDESQLVLWYQDSQGWKDATETCPQAGETVIDTGANTVIVQICKPGRFQLVGPTHPLFLPLTQQP